MAPRLFTSVYGPAIVMAEGVGCVYKNRFGTLLFEPARKKFTFEEKGQLLIYFCFKKSTFS